MASLEPAMQVTNVHREIKDEDSVNLFATSAAHWSTIDIGNLKIVMKETKSKSDVALDQLSRSRAWKMETEFEDENTNLTLHLFRQLPDPESYLFLEHWRDTPTFICFSQLPTEIRFKIWRSTFPKACNVFLILDSIMGTNELPLALSINTESRTETLKHYCLYNHENWDTFRIFPQRLCFDPSRDTLYWPYFYMIRMQGDSSELQIEIHRFISDFCTQNVAHIRRIHSLHINFIFQQIDLSFKDMFKFNNPDMIGRLSKGHFFPLLFKFPVLKKLVLDFAVPTTETVFNAAREDIKLLEQNSRRFKGGKAPEVIVGYK